MKRSLFILLIGCIAFSACQSSTTSSEESGDLNAVLDTCHASYHTEAERLLAMHGVVSEVVRDSFYLSSSQYSENITNADICHVYNALVAIVPRFNPKTLGNEFRPVVRRKINISESDVNGDGLNDLLIQTEDWMLQFTQIDPEDCELKFTTYTQRVNAIEKMVTKKDSTLELYQKVNAEDITDKDVCHFISIANEAYWADANVSKFTVGTHSTENFTVEVGLLRGSKFDPSLRYYTVQEVNGRWSLSFKEKL